MDGLYHAFPFICSKPRGCDAGVGYVEDGHGEGLEGWGCRDGKVYDLNTD